MANPIPYNYLFDIDGLKAAIKELQVASDEYSEAATSEFETINKAVVNLKKELEAVNALLAKPIKLTDEAGQQQVAQLAEQVANLTQQYNKQQEAIKLLNLALMSNKQAVSDAKVLAAQYAAELKKEQGATQQVRTEIANTTLQMKQLTLANQIAKASTSDVTTEYEKLLQKQKDLKNNAQNIGAAFGVDSDEYKKAAVSARSVNQEISNINKGLSSTGTQSTKAALSLGGLFGRLREIAYILPGLGLAGLIGIIVTGVAKLVEVYTNYTNAVKLNNEVQSRASQNYAEKASQVKELATEVQHGNLTQERSYQIIEQLNAISPTYFGNLKSVDDLYKKLPGDLDAYNKALVVTSRIQAEQALIAENYKKQLQDEIDVQYTDLIKNPKNFTQLIELLKYVYTFRGGAFGKQDAETAAQNIKLLNDKLTKDKDLLKKAGGDIAGEQLKIQQGITNSALDYNRQLVQDDLNAQNQIAENQQKSFSSRKAALKKALDDQKQIIDFSITQQLNTTGLTAIQERAILDKANFDKLNAERDYNKKVIDLQNELTQARFNNTQKRLEFEKNVAKEQIDLDGNSFDKRFAALAEYYDISKKEIAAKYKEQVALAGQNYELLKSAKIDFNNDQQKLDNEYLTYENKINDDILKQRLKNVQNSYKEMLTAAEEAIIHLKDDLTQQEQDINASVAERELALSKQYRDGIISQTKYRDKVKEIDDKAASDKLNVELETAKAILLIRQTILNTSNTTENQKAYEAALQQVNSLKLALDKLGIKSNNDAAEQTANNIKEVVSYLDKAAASVSKISGNQGIGALFSDLNKDVYEGFNSIEKFSQLAIDSIGTYTDFAIEASQRRVEALQKEADHDLSLVNDNKEAKLAIQEKYNQKINEEQKKQARLQKAAAIIDIITNTAVAISKTLATASIFGIPLIPVIAGLGAAEIAVVLAQPLPQYEKGRKGGPAEFAEVNEKGPELIGQKGKWRLANRGMRGVTYLNNGDEVKTATDTKMLMASGMLQRDSAYTQTVSKSREIYDHYIMTSSRSSSIDYERMAGAVADGVSGLPITEHNWNERGYSRAIKVKNTRMLNISQRNRF